MTNLSWSTLSSETLYESPWLSVTRELIATPTRATGVPWTIVRRPVAAVIAPRTPDGGYLLIRQERVPIKQDIWEFPAGQVEGEANDQKIIETARRELSEEAGVHCPQELISLGFFYSSAGFTDECCHLFLAPGVIPHTSFAARDEHEAIHEVRSFTPAELRNAIAEGIIIDANTLAAFARLSARGLFL